MYSMARDAYNTILDPFRESPALPLLQVTDLWVNTSIINAAEVGQQNQPGFGVSGCLLIGMELGWMIVSAF